MKAHLDRLVDHHGEGILGEFAVKLKLWPDPDGLYLIKGGGPDVWKRFPRIRKDWRKPQGIIVGKRCGTSQNLGPAARTLLIQANNRAARLDEQQPVSENYLKFKYLGY
jgi:hypothetical protein